MIYTMNGTYRTRMVEMVDTKDLKSFAKIKRGGSSPSVSIILKGR